MSTAAAFQSGLDAVKAGRFAEAIETLEDLCDGKVKPPSKAYYQVKMNLVRAYRGNGQLPDAIKLCRQLSTSSHPQVQQWAQKMLPDLRNPASLSSSETVTPMGGQSVREQPSGPTVIPDESGAVAVAERPVTQQESAETISEVESQPLTPAEADQLLNQGIQIFRRKQYADAIAPLSQFVQGADPAHPNLGYAQTSLAKAYKETDRIDDAIALCKTMLDTPNEGAKAWAKQFLNKYDFKPEPEPVAEETEAPVTPSADEASDTEMSHRTSSSLDRTGGTISEPVKKDYGVPILSAACYASYYLGLIYAILFPANIYGDGSGMLGPIGLLAWSLMNWLGPILVSGTVLGLSKNRVARANAKESINLWITTFAMGLITGALLVGITIIMPLLGLLALVLAIPVMLVFYIAPLIALIVSVARPFEPFKIPLIWHVLE